MDRPKLDIAFVSDVACPWCAIGLASLERALDRVRGEIDYTLAIEPFELNPDMGPEGADLMTYITRKYGRSAEQVKEVQAMIRERGAEVGFAFGERKHVWNTLNAHRMLQWAGEEGRALDLKRALLRAYHAEGRNPGDPRVVAELAVGVGLDPVRAKEIAEGNAYEEEVRAREQLWLTRGVSGVPLVVVNDKYGISGAQPPEAYEQALHKFAKDAASARAA